MKKDTITITRAEYAQLNKAANAAVEHACELFQSPESTVGDLREAARLVDDLKAENAALKERVAELEAERDELEVEEKDMKTWRKVLARHAHYTDAAWDK